MIDWGFAWKVFGVSIIGTFFSIGFLTLIIRLSSIIIVNYLHINNTNDEGE